MMDLLYSLVAADFNFLKHPPIATVFILLLSATINLIMSLANRRTLNLAEYRRIMEESHHVRQELMAAMRSDNKRRIDRAQRRQQEVSQAQMKISGDRMKTMVFFMIPLLIFWPVLNRFFGRDIIAFMPFDAPLLGTNLNMINWYFLCSITTNIIFQRVLGLTFEIEPRASE
jgi:uncharacterized membrane protein (DUF106 family)